MGWKRHLALGAAVFSVWVPIQAFLFDWYRTVLFGKLNSDHPNLAALLASLIASMVGAAAVTTIAIGSWKWERSKRTARVDAVRHWSEREMQKLVFSLSNFARELIIELRHAEGCVKGGLKYDSSRWDRLADACDLIIHSSQLYNIAENRDIQEYMNNYPELAALKQEREVVVEGLNTMHRLLSAGPGHTVSELYKIFVLMLDLREVHMDQLRRTIEGIKM